MADTGVAEYKRSNHQTSQSPSLSLLFQHFQVLRADKFQIALQIVRILFNLLPVFRPCQKIWVLSKREFPILDKGVISTFNRSDVDGMIRRCFNRFFQGFLITIGQCPFVPLYFFEMPIRNRLPSSSKDSTFTEGLFVEAAIRMRPPMRRLVLHRSITAL